MNEMTTRQGTAVADPNANVNYFTSYGDQMSQQTIVGKLLKFSKGDWIAGEDNEDVEHGTKFIANMDEFLVGWIKWENNKPIEHVMGNLAQGYAPPKRHELPDQDESKWEIDPASKEPRDPWQFTNYLLLKRLDDDGRPINEDGNDGAYTLTVSSKGGISAMARFTKAFGAKMRQRPDQWPIVELEGDSYPHKNKAFGRIKVPVFNLTGWISKDQFTLDKITTEDPEPQLPIDKPKTGARF